MVGTNFDVEQGKDKYQFGVCGAAGKPCLENAGACLLTGGQQSSMGVANDNLLLSDTKQPYLEYNSGSVCGDLKKQWVTKIEFVCSRDGAPVKPKIIENTNCQLLIHFPTELVCQPEVSAEYVI